MKIGVISDTNDQQELILQCIKKLNEANVGLVIHCGDWVSPFFMVTTSKSFMP
jgi:predicted phosphodiesterase